MEQKSLMKIQGELEALSRTEENLLKGGFGEVGTSGIQPLGFNLYCPNTKCTPSPDDTNILCANNECSTSETTDETSEDTSPAA